MMIVIDIIIILMFILYGYSENRLVIGIFLMGILLLDKINKRGKKL